MKASKVNRADLIWKVRNNEKKKLHGPFIYTYKCPPWRKWFLELNYILDFDERLKGITSTIYNKATQKYEATLHFSKVERQWWKQGLAVTTVVKIATPVKWWRRPINLGAKIHQL